ncbi:MAG: PucR family transcriptional regulator [Sporichthyaceae bacterium]
MEESLFVKTVLHPSDHALLSPVADALESRAEELTRRQLRELATVRSYRSLPKDALSRSSRRNVVRVVAMLRGQANLPPEIEESELESGRQRALQGVPTEDVVTAYRLVMGVLRDELVEASGAANVPLEVTLRVVRQMWELTDDLSTELVAARRQIDVEVARREEQQRITFLARALSGALTGEALVKAAAAHGLEPDRNYWVVRASVHPLDGSVVLAGPVDGDVAAILSTRPQSGDGVAAVAEPVHLGGLPAAWVEASRLLTVAVRFGRSGVVDRSALGIQIAVVEEDELGEALHARYVVPVLAEPGGDALLESVRTFLAADANVARGAAALSVHQNTLRQRLDKYRRLTGADLDGLEATFEVWWAIQYWTLHRS